MIYQINLIGAGRLGQHWLAAFSEHPNLNIRQVLSRHLNPKENNWPIITKISALNHADITFICVADEELPSVIEQIAHHSTQLTRQTFVHCAGRYSSDLLAPLAESGAFVASVHPLRAFTKQINVNAFHNCPVSLEGDENALMCIESILQHLGAKPFRINTTVKTLYHSACALASNGLVGLIHATNQLFSACNIPPEMARQLTLALTEASINNCRTHETLLDALTGPIAREDKQTIHAHLKSLDIHSDIQKLYCDLSQQILSLTNDGVCLEDWLAK